MNSILAIADAINIIDNARVGIHPEPLWDKLYRIGRYLEKQYEAELRLLAGDEQAVSA